MRQWEYRRKVDASGEFGLSTAQECQEYLDSIWRAVPDGIVYMVSVDLDVACYGLFGEVKGRRIQHFAWVDRHGQLAFAGRAQEAPVVHFGGPLTLRVNPVEKLRRGIDPGQTTLCLGTPGLGPGSFVTMSYDLVPKNMYPVVEVQFPAKENGQHLVARRYVLKQRC